MAYAQFKPNILTSGQYVFCNIAGSNVAKTNIAMSNVTRVNGSRRHDPLRKIYSIKFRKIDPLHIQGVKYYMLFS